VGKKVNKREQLGGQLPKGEYSLYLKGGWIKPVWKGYPKALVGSKTLDPKKMA